MTNLSSVLTVIPAKRRSTRLPNKNIRRLGAKTLLEQAIDQARISGVCGTIAVSTDDEKTAAIARETGAEVPFLRGAAYAEDHVGVGEAAAEMLRRYRVELGKEFQDFCLLLTTCPLRSPRDIVESYRLYQAHPEVDAVMSVAEYDYPPGWAITVDSEGFLTPLFPEQNVLDRPQLPRALLCNGAVYWARASFFEQVNGDQYVGKTLPYIMPRERSIDIDTPFDWLVAELIVDHRTREGEIL